MTRKTKPPVDAALISIADAAVMCGISVRMLYRMMAKGAFGPAPVRLGALVRFRKAEVSAWIEADCPPSMKWRN